MKLITALFLLIAVSTFGAVPTTRSFRATGGLAVTTNDITGIVTYDGSGISSPTGGVSAATVTNIVLGNGTKIAPGVNVTVATNVTSSNTIYTVSVTNITTTAISFGTNTLYFTNECVTTADADTNHVIVSGAGTAGANGTYDWGTENYTNRAGTVGIWFDGIDYVITNSAGTTLYGTGSGFSDPLWDVVGGAGPAPGSVYGSATNCTPVVGASSALKLPPISTNMYVNIATGNDTNAVRGRLDRPWKTITGALRAHVPGDRLIVDAGVYPETDGGTLILTNRCCIIGAGRGSVFIGTEGGFEDSLFLCSDTYLDGFTFHGKVVLGSGQSFDSGTTAIDATNAYIRNVTMNGRADALAMDTWANFIFEDGSMTDVYDGVANWDDRGRPQTAYFRNVHVVSAKDAAGGFNTIHGVSWLAGNLFWDGGSITVSNGQIDNACVFIPNSTNAAATMIFNGVRMAHFTTNGAYSSVVKNSNAANVLIMGTTPIEVTPILVNSSITNQASDHIVGVTNANATHTVGRTNRLIDTTRFGSNGFLAGKLTVTIYDKTATAAGTNIWIVPFGGQTINGAPLTNIVENYGNKTLTVGGLGGTNWVLVTATAVAGSSGGSNFLFDANQFTVGAGPDPTVAIKANGTLPGVFVDNGLLYGVSAVDYGLYYDSGIDTLFYQDGRFSPNYTNIAGISNGFWNFFISPRLESIPAGSLLRSDAARRIAATTIGANLTWDGTTLAATGGGTGASTNEVLTNLIGTVTRNVTNVVSLSTSNATSKPITNSFTAGTLTLRGLEAGANTTITANPSNYVIASTGGGGLAGHSNAIAYINPQGTALTYYDTGNSMTNPGFGFNPTTLGGPHGGYAGLMVFANDSLGLVTIGHPNPGADFATFATAFVVSNRYNSAGGYKNDMIKFDAVIVNGGNLQSDSTLTRWRVWQAPSGGGASTSSNDVAEITVGGDLKLAGGLSTGVGVAGNGIIGFGTNFTMVGAVSSNSSYEITPTNSDSGIMIRLPVVAGVTNQRVHVALGNAQYLTYNGTAYVPSNLPSGGGSSNYATLASGFLTAGGIGLSNTLTTSNIVATAPGSSIFGITNGGNAAAGVIGEYLQATVTNINCGATTEYSDATNLVLTAGDWELTALVRFARNGATTTIVNWGLGISSTSGNSSVGLSVADNFMSSIGGSTISDNLPLTVPNWRFNTPTNVTLYLKTAATYSAGTPTVSGKLMARRVR